MQRRFIFPRSSYVFKVYIIWNGGDMFCVENSTCHACSLTGMNFILITANNTLETVYSNLNIFEDHKTSNVFKFFFEIKFESRTFHPKGGLGCTKRSEKCVFIHL